MFSKFVCSWLCVLQGFYSRPTKTGKIICFPRAGAHSLGVGLTPIDLAQSSNRNTHRTVAKDCLSTAEMDGLRFLLLFRREELQRC